MMIPPLVDFIAFLVSVFAAGFFFDVVFLLAMADLLSYEERGGFPPTPVETRRTRRLEPSSLNLHRRHQKR
jgi:hypothetical protein